jgi:hypothetical protein
MTQKTCILFSFPKTVLLFSFIIICTLTTPTNVAGAAEVELTVENVKKEAENYLDTGECERFTELLERLATGPVAPEMKEMLEGVRSSTNGETLKNIMIEKQAVMFPADANLPIIYLLKITGFEGILHGKPLFKIAEKYVALSRGVQEKDDLDFVEKLKTYIESQVLPAKKSEIKPLIDVIEAGKGNTRHQSSHLDYNDIFWTVVEISPTLLRDLKLEKLSQYFDVLANKPEGRKILRTYRLDDGRSLLQYFVNGWNNPNRNRYIHTILSVIKSYVSDDIPITPDVLDTVTPDFPYQQFITKAKNDATLRKFLRSYRNGRGQNFAHLICEHISDSDHESMLSSLRSAIDNDAEFFVLLNATDQNGKSVKSTTEATSWGPSLLQKIVPHQMVEPDDYGATPLMRMAFDHSEDQLNDYLDTLQRLGIATNQTDVYGNTVQSIRAVKARERIENPFFALLEASFRHHPLNADLWNAIANFSYFPVNPFYLFQDALHVVRNQPNQTPVHHAFIHLKAENEDVRREAKSLWKSFYRIADDLWQKSVELSDENELRMFSEIKNLPVATRYVATLYAATNCIDSAAVLETEKITKVLSGNSIFGLNFSRKVTPLAAKIAALSIYSVARIAGDVAVKEYQELNEPDLPTAQSFFLSHINKMIDPFFEIYQGKLDKERKEKLLNHRLNQAVFALSRFIQETGNEVFGFLKEDDLFCFIDTHLNSRASGIAVNSKARIEKIKSLLPEDSEVGLMPASSFYKHRDDRDDD